MPQWLQAIEDAWLVVPLLLHDRLSGYIVLLRSKGGVRLDWEVRDLLKTAARQAASYIGEVEAARALLVARQFDSFNRMSAFVVHDLKNLVAQLSLLVANAERHKHTPAFQDDVVETLSFSVDKMKRLLTQLAGAQPGEPPTAFALYPVLQEAVSAARHLRPMPRLMPGNARLTVFAHAARLQRVVGHLVQNAVEATAPEGSVTVSLRSSADLAVIEVTDTGRGMSEEFIATRLFNPFQSTKSGGMGIGAYETREYMRELGGRVEVQSVPGRGTSFRLLMPAQDRAGSARTVQIAGIST
jgi:putative PEP-CTERM system histidine kinase